MKDDKTGGTSSPTPPEDKKDTPAKSSPTGCQQATEGCPPPAPETGKLIDNTVKVTDQQKDEVKQKKEKKAQKVKIYSTFRPVIDFQDCLKGLGIKYRTHAFRGTQISLDQGKTWVGGTKELDSFVYNEVLRRCNLMMKNSKGKFETKPANFAQAPRNDAIASMLHQHRYDPLVDWINDLPTERCDNAEQLLGRVFTPDLDDSGYSMEHVEWYYRDLLMLIIKGIIMRTLYPGCSFPFFPIFVGQQGCGKSYGIQLILPPEIAQDAFVDSLDMSLPTKEKEMILRDAAIVECSELAGRNQQKDVAEHKSFVSTKNSKIRVPYSRYPEQVLRRAIAIGTSNDDECLPVDPTGDRRTIIVPVARYYEWSKTDVETKLPEVMDEWRDRLFSHAKWLIAQGQDCSYRWWKKSSLEMRTELITKAEKRAYWLELAIDELLLSPILEEDFGSNKYRFTEDQKKNGVPLQVSMDSTHTSIMKMLKYNTARDHNVPRSMSAKLVGDTLAKKRWEKERRRLNGRGNPVTCWKPPTKSTSN